MFFYQMTLLHGKSLVRTSVNNCPITDVHNREPSFIQGPRYIHQYQVNHNNDWKSSYSQKSSFVLDRMQNLDILENVTKKKGWTLATKKVHPVFWRNCVVHHNCEFDVLSSEGPKVSRKLVLVFLLTPHRNEKHFGKEVIVILWSRS